jgi:hypothetical protein
MVVQVVALVDFLQLLVESQHKAIRLTELVSVIMVVQYLAHWKLVLVVVVLGQLVLTQHLLAVVLLVLAVLVKLAA